MCGVICTAGARLNTPTFRGGAVMTDADREIMHELLDKILDSGQKTAEWTEFSPGIPGKVPAVEKSYRLEIKEASLTVVRTRL